MTTSSAENLETESYNKLMLRHKEPFKVIELFPTAIMIDEEGIRNTASTYLAALSPSEKIAEQ